MIANQAETEFEDLLEHIKLSRGFNFTGYKRSTLQRRFQKRMQTLGIRQYTDYVDYLEVYPDEFTALFNTILINVTGFFRDREAWDYLNDEITKRIILAKDPNEPIRVWSAGCASGEETFTVAMILCEALREDVFRERVKIYATDLDEEALTKARLATYTEKEIEGIPPDFLAKYFSNVNGTYTFRKDLRRVTIFGRHDLIQDAPISRVDLLICRNILMYFNAETQHRILSRLHFALNNNGILFLGKAEMLFTHSSLFTPINLKWRLFQKVPRANAAGRLAIINHINNEDVENQLVSNDHTCRIAFDLGQNPEIVIDQDNTILQVNEKARTLFGITARELGRAFHELEVSYRPIELRSCIEKARSERTTIYTRNAEWKSLSGENRYLDVQVVPLFEKGDILGFSITFTDLTFQKRLQAQLERTNQELETAMEELQSTNEELETTNEELQSTIEELETTNEELQSTNEEHETMNEELQSTNEELETMNSELQRRTEELNQINLFFESILASLDAGVVVVNPELDILVWNQRAEDLWGLRAPEVQGRNLFSLDFGLPVEQLKKPLRSCLESRDKCNQVIVDARNRRGRDFQCKLILNQLHSDDLGVQGLIILMEETN